MSVHAICYAYVRELSKRELVERFPKAAVAFAPRLGRLALGYAIFDGLLTAQLLAIKTPVVKDGDLAHMRIRLVLEARQEAAAEARLRRNDA
jgi:hypothetical protein